MGRWATAWFSIMFDAPQSKEGYVNFFSPPLPSYFYFYFHWGTTFGIQLKVYLRGQKNIFGTNCINLITVIHRYWMCQLQGESTVISCGGNRQSITIYSKAVRSTNHWNAAIVHLMMPYLPMNKKKNLIGIIVILL